MQHEEGPMQNNLEMYISTDRLALWAANTAAGDRVDGNRFLNGLRRKLQRDLRDIDRICSRVPEHRANRDHPSELEWLLDNRYLVQREGRLVLLLLRSMRFERFPAQKGEVIRIIIQMGFFVQAATRSHIYLASYNGFNAAFFRFPVKIHHTI